MADVFVSYSRRDREFVGRLVEALEQRGRDVWVDLDDIPPTAEWLAEVFAGIEGADDVVVVLSPDSVVSEVAGKEIAHAVLQGKRIVPLLHREPGSTPVPDALASRNWISFRAEDDFAASVETLIAALDTDLEWVRAHTRLLTRAVEWEAKGHDASLLLRGGDLRDSEAWLAGQRPDREPQPTPLQSRYLVAGRQAATRRQRMTLGATLAALAVSIGLGVFATTQRNEAQRQSRTAQARELAANAEAQLEIDPQLSLLLAQEAVERRPTAEATAALRASVAASHVEEILAGHGDLVTWAEWSPDGKTIVTSSRDGTARLWGRGDDGPYAILRGHGDWVTRAVFSPDGTTVLTTSRDGTARLWDARTGSSGPVVERSDRGLSVSAFSPDGAAVLTCGRDPRTHVRWLGSERSVTLTGHRAWVSTCAWSPDGTRVATGSDDGTARIWRVATGTPTVLETGAIVIGVVWSPDGSRLATTSPAGPAMLWDGQTGERIAVLPHEAAVLSAAFSHDGRRLLTGSFDDTARIWDAKTGAEEVTLTSHRGEIYSVAWSEDDTLVATASGDESIRIWSPRGVELTRLLGHEGFVRLASFDDSGRRVLSAGDDGTVRLWNVGERAHRPELDTGLPLRSAFFADAGETVVTLAPSAVTLWSAEAGTRRGSATFPNGLVALVPDGTRALVVSGTAASLLETSTGAISQSLVGHAGEVTGGAFSPDGAQVVTVSEDATARVWEVASGRMVASLEGHADDVEEASWSTDGTWIVTAGADESARIWEARTGRQVMRLRGHSLGLTSAAFSPDGERVVTASQDGTARIWSTRTGRQLVRLQGHVAIDGVRESRAVTDATFDPAGRVVATVGWDGTARVWDAATGRELLTLSRSVPPTELSIGEILANIAKRLERLGAKPQGEVPTGAEADVHGGDLAASVAFDPISSRLVVAAQDGVARIFACPVCGPEETILTRARQLTVRTLSTTEKQRYGATG